MAYPASGGEDRGEASGDDAGGEATVAYHSSGDETGEDEDDERGEEQEGMECEPTVAYNLGKCIIIFGL